MQIVLIPQIKLMFQREIVYKTWERMHVEFKYKISKILHVEWNVLILSMHNMKLKARKLRKKLKTRLGHPQESLL